MVAMHDFSCSGPLRQSEYGTDCIITGRTGDIDAVMGSCTEFCVLNDLDSGRQFPLARSCLTSQALQTNLITPIVFFSLCDVVYIEPGKTSIVNN